MGAFTPERAPVPAACPSVYCSGRCPSHKKCARPACLPACPLFLGHMTTRQRWIPSAHKLLLAASLRLVDSQAWEPGVTKGSSSGGRGVVEG